MRIRSTLMVMTLVLGCLLPAIAHAAPAVVPAKPKSSRPATGVYELDFTLPTAGKSGCLVCHGDPNLVRPSGNATVTLFVNAQILQGSAHKDVPCTGCHVDFAYKVPHTNAKDGSDWRAVAKDSCKNASCHEDQFGQILTGAHSPLNRPGEDPKLIAAARVAKGKPAEVPLCGDCHGAHDIRALKEPGVARQLHQSGLRMCGTCHKAETSSYTDYYHGAAYRRGAPDAPACWDCHGAHNMLPAKDKKSAVSDRQLPITCGKCHKAVNPAYVSYAPMIHRRADIESGVPMNAWWNAAEDALRQAVLTVKSWF